MEHDSLRHLQALRSFIKNLIEQAERSAGCECSRPPSLLLVGPPGAGKTYLVKQLSSVCDMPLFGVHTHHLNGPYSLRSLFGQARELDYPSLFFLDDLEHIYSNQDSDPGCSPTNQAIREELFQQLGHRKLKIFDSGSDINPVQHPVDDTDQDTRANPGKRGSKSAGLENEFSHPDNDGLIIIAATSSPWLLYNDHELLSRFRGVYLVGLPDRQTRFNILKNLLQKVQHSLTEKDIWIVADKTEGFTPSDLMIVIKALNYKQFAFLFSLTGSHDSEGSSEADECISSSEMTETESESDLESLPEAKLAKAQLVKKSESSILPFLLASTATSTDSPRKSAPNETALTRKPLGKKEGEDVCDDTNPKSDIDAIGKDWDSEESEASQESVTEKLSCDAPNTKDQVSSNSMSHSPGGSDELSFIESSIPSPDSALGLSKSSEDDIDLPKKVSSVKVEETLLAFPEGGTPPPVCDNNNLSAINHSLSDNEGELLDDNEVLRDIELKKCGDLISKCVTDAINESFGNLSKNIITEKSVRGTDPTKFMGVNCSNSSSLEDVAELHFRYCEPPDPLRNDNQGIDSDRDSDPDNDAVSACRSRRVNFSGITPMEPLSVDIDTTDAQINSNSLINFSSTFSTMMNNTGITNDSHQGTSTNVILRSLLARSSANSNFNNLDVETRRAGGLNIKRDNDLDYGLGCHGTLSIGGGPTVMRRSPNNLDQSGLYDNDDSSSALKKLLNSATGPKISNPESSDSLVPTPTSITPTPSDVSTHSGSQASSGSGARITGASSGSDNRKKQDSESSYCKSDSHTRASSDISTATCNETGETLECQSDSEERFRNLAEDLTEQQTISSASEDEVTNKKRTLRELINLEDLGALGIQILTLTDVLEAVSKTSRSISDEEIKRYTDFMMWFANVAKSACPHNCKDNKGKPSLLDDISLVSTISVTPSQAKKRKKPLRKVGRFLLKALMFILD